MTTFACADNLDLAIQIASLGWYVFPCGQNKTPLLLSAHPAKDDPLRGKCHGECGQDGHGWHDGTTDFDKINAWWQAHPAALVGIACAPSGLFVLDCDRPGSSHPDSADGWQEFIRLNQEHNNGGPVEVGPLQATPGNGFHLVFKCPKLPADFAMPARLAPGIDIRYQGYICTGALTDGRAYAWQDEHNFDTRLTNPPRWVARLLLADYRQAQEQKAQAQAKKTKMPTVTGAARHDLPGEDFNLRATWESILQPVGFSRAGKEGHWTRPNGTRGHTHYITDDKHLWAFTTNSQPLESGKQYTKFGAFAALYHGGDYRKAAQALRAQGYGCASGCKALEMTN